MKKSLSVIIPAYNEEKAIKETISGLKKELKKLDLDYEIIVINDASTDKTKKILEKNKEIKLINHPHNRGYGASLKTGIKESKNEWILIIDADGTYPIESIPELIKYSLDYDMVVGARTKKSVKIPLVRKPAKWMLNKLANCLCSTKIPDLNSGLRIMRKGLVKKFISILPNGFSFTTTITLAALTNDYSVKYIPINYERRIGKSKIKPIKDTLNFFQLIIKTILYFNPLKVFVPLSLFLFLASMFVLVYSSLFTPRILDTTTAILFISSIQLLAIGMLAELIVKLNIIKK